MKLQWTKCLKLFHLVSEKYVHMFEAFHVPFLRKAHKTLENYKKCGVGIILKHLYGPGVGVCPGGTEIMYQVSRLLFTVLRT